MTSAALIVVSGKPTGKPWLDRVFELPWGVRSDDALGGNRFARASAELAFPIGLPDEFGVERKRLIVRRLVDTELL